MVLSRTRPPEASLGRATHRYWHTRPCAPAGFTSCFFILEAVVCPEDNGQVNSVPDKFNTVPHSLAWTAAGAVVQKADPPPDAHLCSQL